jgi:hypothetical protein
MEFNSRQTNTHILQPLAYNQMRKIRRKYAPVRSAQDQCSIHHIAYMFESPVLKVPRPYDYDDEGYIMDVVQNCECIIHPHGYSQIPPLFNALVEFCIYMLQHGFFPRDYSVLKRGAEFFVMDFSRFGTIYKGLLRFPKDRRIYTLQEAVELYGLRVYVPPPQAPAPPAPPQPQPPQIEEPSAPPTSFDDLTTIANMLEQQLQQQQHMDAPMLFEEPPIYVENEHLLESFKPANPEPDLLIQLNTITCSQPAIGLDGSIYM